MWWCNIIDKYIRYAKDTMATGPGTSKNLPNVDNMLTLWFADNILFGAIFFCWPYDCRQYFLLAVCFAPVCCFSSNPPLVLTSAVQATDQDLKLCLNYNFFWESFRQFFFFYFSGAPVVVVSYPSTLKLKGLIIALLCLFRIYHFGFVIKHSW